MTAAGKQLSVLMPYQQRWVADRSEVKVAEKSRQIGFSWCAACEAVRAASPRSGARDVWYVGYNRDMAQEFIRDCAFWAGVFELAASAIEEEVIRDEDKDILTFVIRLASGKRITALSSRPSNLRSKRGFVVIDEAAFHEHLDELLKAALALTIWGGRVAIISTHDGVSNEFNKLVTDIRAGKLPYSLHRISFDDALGDGLYKKIAAKQGRVWAAEDERAWREKIIAFYGDNAGEELHVIPKDSGGRYIARALVEARMFAAPVVRLKLPDSFTHEPSLVRKTTIELWCAENLLPLLAALPADCAHVFGQDFGRVGDLSVIAPATIMRNLVRRAPFLVELSNVPFHQQEQILFFIVDHLPRFRAGALDARGNGQYLAEVAAQRYGASRIDQVMLSDKWYLDNMPRFRAGFQDALLEIPRDDDVLEDFGQLQQIRGVPKLTDATRKGHGGEQRHGDAVIALALADSASRLEVSPIEFQATGIRRESLDAFEDRAARARDDVGFGVVAGGVDLRGW
jgi:phage FluMu gp28-like protein